MISNPDKVDVSAPSPSNAADEQISAIEPLGNGAQQIYYYCVKASAAFKKQNKQLNTYKLICTLFAFERNVYERNQPEEPSRNRPRNPV